MLTFLIFCTGALLGVFISAAFSLYFAKDLVGAMLDGQTLDIEVVRKGISARVNEFESEASHDA